MSEAVDILGQRFGHLRVIAHATRPELGRGGAWWHVVCDCGGLAHFRGVDIRSGGVTGCADCRGSRLAAGKTKHGHRSRSTPTPEFSNWRAMITRCTKPTHPNHANYGARGITVCERWRDSFEAFFADMGPRPSSQHSLDRFPNNDGNYEPGNVRWATDAEQAQNTTNSKLTDRVTAAVSNANPQFVDEALALAASLGVRYKRVRDAIKRLGVGPMRVRPVDACVNGHPYDAVNTRTSAKRRVCLACQREYSAAHDRRRRGAA